jgi:hypothetical protein
MITPPYARGSDSLALVYLLVITLAVGIIFYNDRESDHLYLEYALSGMEFLILEACAYRFYSHFWKYKDNFSNKDYFSRHHLDSDWLC